MASQMGRTDIVQLLLDRGADVDAPNWDQATPLYVASADGKLGVEEMLLKQGADVNSRNKWSWSPLHVAAREGYCTVVQPRRGGERIPLAILDCIAAGVV